MSREQYFEMCKMLKIEPVEEDIPVSRESLTSDTQLILSIYDKLPAKWDGFSGNYMGKDLMLLPILCEEYGYDDYLRKYAWEIIPVIDSFVAEDIAKKIKSKMNKREDASGRRPSNT